MKKVNVSYWAVVCDGEIICGDITGPAIHTGKRDINAIKKNYDENYPEYDFRVARIKVTEVTPKEKKG